MIRKTEKLLITFYTTTDAMNMEYLCKERGMAGRIIPVPGSITADCGLAWCADPQSEEILRDFMKQHNLTFQGMHLCLV